MKQSNAFDTFKLTNKEKSIYYMSLIIQIYLIYSILTNDEHPNNKFAPPSDLFEEIEGQRLEKYVFETIYQIGSNFEIFSEDHITIMNNIYEIICKENQLALKNMHSQLDDIMRIYKQRNYDEYITAHIEILHNSFNVFSALFNNLSLTDIKYINEEIINEINYVRKELYDYLYRNEVIVFFKTAEELALRDKKFY